MLGKAGGCQARDGLAYTSPAFAVPLALAVGEEVSPLRVVGAVLVACGVAIALYSRPSTLVDWRGYLAGVASALLASLSYALALAVAVIVYQQGVTPVELTFYRSLLPLPLLTPWAPRSRRDYVSTRAALIGLGGILGSVLGVYTYYLAMAYSGMMIAVTIPGAAPALTLALAARLLGEKLTGRQAVGATLAIVGAVTAAL